jgi:hypothetical protein
MIEFSQFITKGHAFVFDRYDNCIGHLFANLTEYKETETTKNAADDKLTLEIFIFRGHTEEMKMLQNENSIFVPYGIAQNGDKIEGALYKIKNVYLNDDGGDNVVVGVECKSALIEMLDEVVLYLPNNGVTPQVGLQSLLEHYMPSRFLIDFMDPRLASEIGGLIYMNEVGDASKTNKLNYLIAMVELYGGEISCRAKIDPATGKIQRYINWYYKRGRDLGKLLLLTKDMKKVNISINTDNIITRVDLRGKLVDGESITMASATTTGLPYVQAEPTSARYKYVDYYADGTPKQRVYINYEENEDNPINLRDKANAILNKCGDPIISIEAEIFALNDYTGDFLDGGAKVQFGKLSPEPWFIGDVVSIYTENLAVFTEQFEGGILDKNTGCVTSRVVEYERDHLFPEKSRVTIQSTCVGITDDVMELQKLARKKNYLVVTDTDGTPITVELVQKDPLPRP